MTFLRSMQNGALLLALALLFNYRPWADASMTEAGKIVAFLATGLACGLLTAWLFYRLYRQGRDDAFAAIKSASYKATLDDDEIIIVAADPETRARLDRNITYTKPLDWVRDEP